MKYPIQPEHINAKNHMFDAFDNTETEISAGWLVRFVQDRGKSWESFKLEELQAYYNKKFKGAKFHFNRLIDSESIPINLSEFDGNLSESLLNPYIGESKSLGGGWIVLDDQGNYYFTHDFIARCFKASPVITENYHAYT